MLGDINWRRRPHPNWFQPRLWQHQMLPGEFSHFSLLARAPLICLGAPTEQQGTAPPPWAPLCKCWAGEGGPALSSMEKDEERHWKWRHSIWELWSFAFFKKQSGGETFANFTPSSSRWTAGKRRKAAVSVWHQVQALRLHQQDKVNRRAQPAQGSALPGWTCGCDQQEEEEEGITSCSCSP